MESLYKITSYTHIQDYFILFESQVGKHVLQILIPRVASGEICNTHFVDNLVTVHYYIDTEFASSLTRNLC